MDDSNIPVIPNQNQKNQNQMKTKIPKLTPDQKAQILGDCGSGLAGSPSIFRVFDRENLIQATDRIEKTWKALHPIAPVPILGNQPVAGFLKDSLEQRGLLVVRV